jgi:hypothetical protein
MRSARAHRERRELGSVRNELRVGVEQGLSEGVECLPCLCAAGGDGHTHPGRGRASFRHSRCGAIPVRAWHDSKWERQTLVWRSVIDIPGRDGRPPAHTHARTAHDDGTHLGELGHLERVQLGDRVRELRHVCVQHLRQHSAHGQPRGVSTMHGARCSSSSSGSSSTQSISRATSQPSDDAKTDRPAGTCRWVSGSSRYVPTSDRCLMVNITSRCTILITMRRTVAWLRS